MRVTRKKRISLKYDVASVFGMRSLRERNRLNAMRLTQRVALDMFEERGYDQVTVNEIAEVVGMAASTIFRHFDTKEAIVLWDEHDDDLDDAFETALSDHPPLEAMRRVFSTELGPRYDDDLDFQLRRVKFIYTTEALHAAAIEREFADAAELADALRLVLSAEQQHAATLLAGATMLALDHAFDRWQASDGATPLGTWVDEAFDALADLGSIR